MEDYSCKCEIRIKAIRILTIFVDWVLDYRFSAVVEQLLSKLLCEHVRLTLLSHAMIDVILHIAVKIGEIW